MILSLASDLPGEHSDKSEQDAGGSMIFLLWLTGALILGLVTGAYIGSQAELRRNIGRNMPIIWRENYPASHA
jgi:hypothetical protein